jgi:hypothetical protein
MAFFPDDSLTKLATPLNVAGLLVAYLSWKVSNSAIQFLVVPCCVTFAFLKDANLLLSPAHLCFLFVASQKCSWAPCRQVKRRIPALRGYGWPSSKDD